MVGALQAIRFAREQGWPFLGTWGGFQHALVEYARNVLGIEDAEHEESAPTAPTLLVSKLADSLVGKTQKIKILAGSLVQRAYGRDEVSEQFACNYGLNPQFQDKVAKGQLKITGVDLYGEVRVFEVLDHPFYVATLFLPQISSAPGSPHPLIVAYLRAALAFRTSGKIKKWNQHITGAIAEAFYGAVPSPIRTKVKAFLTPDLWAITENFCRKYRGPQEKAGTSIGWSVSSRLLCMWLILEIDHPAFWPWNAFFHPSEV
jgi:hypothetical protein